MRRPRVGSPVVSAALDELQRQIRAAFGEAVLDMQLFGSVARGTAHEDSDVDVLVVLDTVDHARRREVLNIAADISVDRGVLLSPTVLDRATRERWRAQERPLIMEIEREGIPL